jgi:hypothetical protein
VQTKKKTNILEMTYNYINDTTLMGIHTKKGRHDRQFNRTRLLTTILKEKIKSFNIALIKTSVNKHLQYSDNHTSQLINTATQRS